MEEFGDLDIICTDGTIRASSFVVAKISGAEIFKESLLLDKTKIHMPFSSETIRSVVQFTHGCVGLDVNSLPHGDPARLARIAEALDFMGCEVAFETVLDKIHGSLWRVKDEDVGNYANSLLFKHRSNDFVEDVVRTLTLRFPFWTDFERRVLTDITADVRIFKVLVRGTWKMFPPSWVFSSLCNRIGAGKLEASSAVEILASGFHNGAHPEETAFVIDDIVSAVGLGRTDRFTKNFVSALISIRNSCSPEYFVPLRALSSGTCGSLVTYDFDKKFSVVADLSKASSGARRTYGNVQLRRIADGVRLSIDYDGTVTAAFELDKITIKKPFRIATRFSVMREGRCIAEEWNYSLPDPVAREHTIVSGASDALVPDKTNQPSPANFREEMRRGIDKFLRIDCFYADQKNDADGVVRVIEEKFFYMK
jgi:hypothetical protein